MEALPSLPESIRPLTTPESDRLREQGISKWESPYTSCLTCLGQGTFRARDRDEIREYACECVDQWLLYRYLLHCGIGTKYQRVRWSDIDDQVPPHVLEAVIDYDDHIEQYASNGQGLILYGPNGTGKTFLATLLLKRLISKGHDGYFTQFNELLDSYTRTWGGNTEEDDWFARRVMHAGVLVIDDVGKESKGRTNITEPLFDRVLRTRGEQARPTIITTNYSMEQLEAYGGSIRSLMDGGSTMVEVTGTDYRPEDRKRSLQDIEHGIVRPLVLS